MLKRILTLARTLVHSLYSFFFAILFPFLRFNLILIFYLINLVLISNLYKIKIIPKSIAGKVQRIYSRFYVSFAKYIDKDHEGSISSISIMELAISNMKAKKSRTFVTIGGVAIGIGAIVFLVSLGYGLQELVIGRVAKLYEMKQASVSPKAGSKQKLTDETISAIKNINNVSNTLPLIAVVGKVNYQNSVSSMAVYGVTSEYLSQSAIQPIQGKIFDSNELSYNFNDKHAEVLGAATQQTSEKYYLNQKISDTEFTIDPQQWIRVREKPSANAKLLGYTRRMEGKQSGEIIAGGAYISDDPTNSLMDPNGNELGKWVSAKTHIWEKTNCDTKDLDCVDGKYKKLADESGNQKSVQGYIAMANVTLIPYETYKGEVLGDSIIDGNANTTQVSNPTSGDWVELPEESSASKALDVQIIPLGAAAKKEAVVNMAMVKVLGLNERDAVGKQFDATFVVTGDLLADVTKKVESEPTKYTIVGVIADDKSPVFYVPYIDLRSLGISKFSQLKVVTDNKDNLARVRKQIEGLGYGTQSVADTVSQINSLFGTIRLILGIMGMVALAVASLGMFNTFTISLMERTREIGLMRALGMKSKEVQELFLTESMIMGFSGGISGIVFGFIMGKLLSAGLTGFAFFKGGGIIDISYIPFAFTATILGLSLVVGIVTGIYPARRAKKISALNALRYE